MFKEEYRSMNEKLAPGAELNARTLARMEAPRSRRPRRALTAVLALLLAACLTLTAAAAVLPGFRGMLFGEASPLAESLTPQTAAAARNGLALEILGTMAQGESFTAYFSLQDLEKADRLSGEMFLDMDIYLDGKRFDHYQGCDFFCEVMKYDEETQTALCRMDLDVGGASAGEAGEALYRLENADVELVLHNAFQRDRHSAYTPITLPAPDTDPSVLPIYGRYQVRDEDGEETSFIEEITPDMFAPTWEEICAELEKKEKAAQGGETSSEEYLIFSGILREAFLQDEEGWIAHLEPGEPVPVPGLEDFVQITKTAYVDGVLYVQLHKEDQALLKTCQGQGQRMLADGFQLLCAKKGCGAADAQDIARKKEELAFGGSSQELLNRLYQYSSGVSGFAFDEAGRVIDGPPEDREGYQEYKYEIPLEELDQYEFFALWDYMSQLELGLTAAFSLEDALPGDTVLYGPVTVGGVTFDQISVSPLGVFARGYWLWDDVNQMEDIELVSSGTVYHFYKIEGSQWSVEYADSNGPDREKALPGLSSLPAPPPSTPPLSPPSATRAGRLLWPRRSRRGVLKIYSQAGLSGPRLLCWKGELYAHSHCGGRKASGPDPGRPAGPGGLCL